MVNNFLIIAAIIYLIGSIPFAFIITKLSGYGDIRNIGSGNVGTTNVLRTGNKPLALIVLIFDIFKGYLPTFYILNYISYFNNYELIAYILGSISILGHFSDNSPQIGWFTESQGFQRGYHFSVENDSGELLSM